MLNRAITVLLLLITSLPFGTVFYTYSMTTTATFTGTDADTLESLIISNSAQSFFRPNKRQ